MIRHADARGRDERRAAPKPARHPLGGSAGVPAGRGAGFTLIELLVVLTIVGILAAAALPLQELTLRRTQEQVLRAGLRSIRMALDAHRSAVEAGQIARGPDGSPWPATLAALVQGVPLLDAQGQPVQGGPRLYLLRQLPRDPFADPTLPAEATWALRASTSPPDAPAPGADVFDLRSRSPRQALDGSTYQEW